MHTASAHPRRDVSPAVRTMMLAVRSSLAPVCLGSDPGAWEEPVTYIPAKPPHLPCDGCSGVEVPGTLMRAREPALRAAGPGRRRPHPEPHRPPSSHSLEATASRLSLWRGVGEAPLQGRGLRGQPQSPLVSGGRRKRIQQEMRNNSEGGSSGAQRGAGRCTEKGGTGPSLAPGGRETTLSPTVDTDAPPTGHPACRPRPPPHCIQA